MLSATEYGLGTIPAMTLTLFPDVLRKELQIPDNLNVTIGIAIGYADTENAINNFVSDRVAIDKTEKTIFLCFSCGNILNICRYYVFTQYITAC